MELNYSNTQVRVYLSFRHFIKATILKIEKVKCMNRVQMPVVKEKKSKQ